MKKIAELEYDKKYAEYGKKYAEYAKKYAVYEKKYEYVNCNMQNMNIPKLHFTQPPLTRRPSSHHKCAGPPMSLQGGRA